MGRYGSFYFSPLREGDNFVSKTAMTISGQIRHISVPFAKGTTS